MLPFSPPFYDTQMWLLWFRMHIFRSRCSPFACYILALLVHDESENIYTARTWSRLLFPGFVRVSRASFPSTEQTIYEGQAWQFFLLTNNLLLTLLVNWNCVTPRLLCHERDTKRENLSNKLFRARSFLFDSCCCFMRAIYITFTV